MDNEKTNIGEKGLSKQSTYISKILKNLKMSLSGYERVGATDEFEYTGEVLAGSKGIKLIMGMYGPFSDESNLMTEKAQEVFSLQKHEINTSMNKLCYTEEYFPEEFQERVVKMCKTTLQNIGDIILSSKDYMRDLLTRPRDDVEDKKSNDDLF